MGEGQQEEGSSTALRRSTRQGKRREMLPPVAIPSSAGNVSGSALTSPSQLRNLPKIDYDTQGPLPSLDVVTVLHPANNAGILQWRAYDRLPGSETKFGVHHETLLNACQIIANNETGYLSEHQDRNAERIDVDLDSILSPGYYYYHVEKVALNPYPICRNFESWTFPHGAMPRSWSAKLPVLPEMPYWGPSWSKVSSKVKDRDEKCRVTGSSEWLSTAHLIPEAESNWLGINKMYLYLGHGLPFDQSPCNLLALRYDCHHAGFDHAQFVFAPKWGKLAIHFLNHSLEFANQYHNILFDHGGTLSQEALYSRFAWAVLKLAVEMRQEKGFKFVDMPKDLDPDIKEERGGRKGRTSRKRKRKNEDNGKEEEGSENHEDADEQAHKRLDVLLQGPNAWLSGVFSQLDNNPSEVDARELEKDLGTAARHLPFFVDSNIQPTAHEQEDLPWYPGVGVVEKLKKKYIASHPNIQAHNLPKASNEFQSNSVLYDSD